MDNNFQVNNEPIDSRATISPEPPSKKSKAIEILLALLKAIGYVAVWLGIQVVLLYACIIVVFIANPSLSLLEITEKVASWSIELTVATNILTLLAIIVFYIIIKKPFLKTIKVSKPHKASYLPTIAIGGSAQYVTALVLGMLILFLPKEWQDSFNENNELIENANQVLAFITAVIVAPIFEEILCRGLILNTLRKAMPKWWAIVVSSAIFGAIHGNPIQFIYATALGILLGWLYTKFDSIFIPMICHLAFNLVSMLNSYMNVENPVVTIILGLIMYASIPVFVLSMVYICVKKFDKPTVSIPMPPYVEAKSEYNADSLARLQAEIDGEKYNNNINNGESL